MLDLLRVIALFMMLQGHTVDVLLMDSARTESSIFYSIWFWLRGYTAPIFMFTAGAVFIYLLIDTRTNSVKIPRVQKGMIRAVQLLVIGYLLRYPSFAVFDFRFVTKNQWLIFFSVDALHLIAVGLIVLIIVSFITVKYDKYILSVLAIIIFILTPFVLNYDWVSILPLPLAGYLTKSFGSIFPLFPYLGFILAGGMFGKILTEKTNLDYVVIGRNTVIFAIGLYVVKYFAAGISGNDNYSLILFQFERLAVLLILVGIVSFVSIKIKSLPRILNIMAKNGLYIYAVHLVLLYGSAWTVGINRFTHREFTVWQSCLSALAMIFTMVLFVVLIDKLKNRKFRKLD